MPKGFRNWDPAETFRSDEDARLLVEEIARDGSPEELRSVIGMVARYYGVQELAKRTGFSAKRIFGELNSLERDRRTLNLLLKRMGVDPAVEDKPADAAE